MMMAKTKIPVPVWN